MKLFVGQAIDGKELEVVAGIREFARRIRELRVQEGYKISSGISREGLKPDQYVLESGRPNAEEAKRWRRANAIRRQPGSDKSRILALLKANVGRPVDGERMAYVARTLAWSRRARELRTQEGYRVVTRLSGRPDLPVGVYVLESLDQLPAHDRKIPDDTYDSVLGRDRNRCRKCGWSVTRRKPGQRRQFLEVHHIEHHVVGGKNNPENLMTLCNVHHDEVHRKRVSGGRFFVWLKGRRKDDSG